MFRKFFIILGVFGIAAISVIIVFYFKNMNVGPTVLIHAKNGNVKFDVEISKTKEEREKGLMNRKSLKQNKGMLFIFEKPSPVNFWMKNTLIPLDMIFIDENLEIAHIENHAAPCPQNDANCPLYSSVVPIKYVLEIGADLAKINNIEVGNNVSIHLVE